MLEIAKIQKKDNKSTSQRDNKFFFNRKSENSQFFNFSDSQILRFFSVVLLQRLLLL